MLAGHVAIWDIGSALRDGKSTGMLGRIVNRICTDLAFTGSVHVARPIHYLLTNEASIRSIAFVRTPPLSRSLDGSLDLASEPSLLVTAGYDGSVTMVDLSESVTPITLYHDRGEGDQNSRNQTPLDPRSPPTAGVMTAVAHLPHLGGIVLPDSDGCVRYIVLKSRDFAANRASHKVAAAIRVSDPTPDCMSAIPSKTRLTIFASSLWLPRTTTRSSLSLQLTERARLAISVVRSAVRLSR